MLSARCYVIMWLFFLAGCATPSPASLHFNNNRTARDLMEKAQALEDAKEYQKAIAEYMSLAEQYPQSAYYQTAIRKVAWLNLQPDYSEADPTVALHWLQVYLTLPISPEERQSEELRVIMLQQANRLKAKLSRYIQEKTDLQTTTKDQSTELSRARRRVEKLESKLAQARIQLEEMKEVDLRMHTRRVNGNLLEPYPKGKSSESMKAVQNSPSSQVKNVQNSLKSVPNADSKENSKALPAENVSSEQDIRVFHPYTVQVRAYADKEAAVNKAIEERKSGDPSFSSQITLPGRGEWFRVFIGVYRTFDEAMASARHLKSCDYPDAFAIKLPYAISVRMADLTDGQQEKAFAELQSMGYLPYRIPKEEQNKTPLLIGAFGTREESEKISDMLRAKGFHPEVVQR